MRIIVSVIDFGEVWVQASADNDDCVRLEFPVGDESRSYIDLDPQEVHSLIFALQAMRDRSRAITKSS